MFFDVGPEGVEKQRVMREALSFVAPDSPQMVRIVAECLKTDDTTYRDVFFEWVKPFGRMKARKVWALAKPDPDALADLLEERLEAANRKSRFEPKTASELEAMPVPSSRIKGVLPAERLAAVYGASGSAKSFLCTSAAAAIASGAPFFGYPTTHAPVLYIALEGEAGYRGRTLAWRRYHGHGLPDDLRFLLQPFRITNEQDVIELAATCPPNVVIFIDTLNRAAPGADENSSKDMGLIIEGAKTLQRLSGGLVVLIAHTGKDATKGLRGHSSLIAALDAAIIVERSGDARTWRLEKSKDGRDGIEHAFRLQTVEIGVDEDGDELTSAVVVLDETRATKSTKPISGNRQTGMAAFNEAAATHGSLADDGSFAGVSIEAWRECFYRVCPSETEVAKRKAFGRARNDLIEDGHVIAAAGDLYRLGGPHAASGNAYIAGTLIEKRDMSRTTA